MLFFSNSKFPAIITLTLVALLSIHCSSTIKVKTLRPSTIVLSPQAHLSIISVKGNKAELRSAIINELTGATQEDGALQKTQTVQKDKKKSEFFSVDDKTAHNLQWQRNDDGTIAIESDDKKSVFLDITLDESIADQTVMREEYWENGIRKYRDIPTRTVTTLMKIIGIHDEKIIFEERIVGKSEQLRELDLLNNEALSAQDAAQQFLRMITPQWVDFELIPDDSGSDQKTIVQLMRAKKFEEALALIKVVTEKSPENSAATIYNHAVILDALAQYQEALELYDKALSLKPKDFYQKMRNDCELRLENQKKLQSR